MHPPHAYVISGLAVASGLRCPVFFTPRPKARRGRAIVCEPAPGLPHDEVGIFLLGTVMGILLHQRGQIVLHVSAAAVDGRAVLFCGPSTAGKSTIAAALAQRGYASVTDDLCTMLNVRPISRLNPRRWARRLWRLSSTRRLYAIEAVAALLVARLALRLVPFSRIARWLGTFVPSHDARVLAAAAGQSARGADVAAEIAWAVSRAARHAPFRAVCLPQALAAHAMLRRRGIASVMHFGGAVAGDRGVVDAHAWLEAAGVQVTGYPVPANIAEIACFI